MSNDPDTAVQESSSVLLLNDGIDINSTSAVVNHDNKDSEKIDCKNTSTFPVNMLMLNNSNIVNQLTEVSNLSSAIITFENGTKYLLHAVEPAAKKAKTDDENIKEMFLSFQKTVMGKLDSIEKKLDKISTRCHHLEEKLVNLVLQTAVTNLDNNTPISNKERSGQVVVAVPFQKSGMYKKSHIENEMNTCFFPLNSEDTYPDGSWLGDPDNSDMRVRCNISPSDLLSLSENCTTAEKMALTLLDYLFDRETQAISNISGTGKYGKLQLDPLKIYGIRCHLKHIFSITDSQWARIKQNLDSKCRAAFKRKQRGMPLTVKAFKNKIPRDSQDILLNRREQNGEDNLQTASTESSNSFLSHSESNPLGSLQDGEVNDANSTQLEITDLSSISLAQLIGESQIIHTEHGDIQVIHATEEQLAQLKENHNIEIVTDANVLSSSNSESL